MTFAALGARHLLKLCHTRCPGLPGCINLFGCIFLLLLRSFSDYTAVGVVGKDIEHNLPDKIAYLAHKERWRIVATLDLAQFILPYSGKLGRLEQLFVYRRDKIYSGL